MRRIAGCILGIAIVGVLACSDGPEMTGPCVGPVCNPPQLDVVALFETTCGNSECHSLEIVFATPLSTHDQAWGWIREMNDNGVTLPDFQHAAIVEYLCDLKGCIDDDMPNGDDDRGW